MSDFHYWWRWNLSAADWNTLLEVQLKFVLELANEEYFVWYWKSYVCGRKLILERISEYISSGSEDKISSALFLEIRKTVTSWTEVSWDYTWMVEFNFGEMRNVLRASRNRAYWSYYGNHYTVKMKLREWTLLCDPRKS